MYPTELIATDTLLVIFVPWKDFLASAKSIIPSTTLLNTWIKVFSWLSPVSGTPHIPIELVVVLNTTLLYILQLETPFLPPPPSKRIP